MKGFWHSIGFCTFSKWEDMYYAELTRKFFGGSQIVTIQERRCIHCDYLERRMVTVTK